MKATIAFCAAVALLATAAWGDQAPPPLAITPSGDVMVVELGHAAEFAIIADPAVTGLQVAFDGTKVPVQSDLLLAVGASSDSAGVGNISRLALLAGRDVFGGVHILRATGLGSDGNPVAAEIRVTIVVALSADALASANTKVRCEGPKNDVDLSTSPSFGVFFAATGGQEYTWVGTGGFVGPTGLRELNHGSVAQGVFQTSGQKFAVVESGGAYGLCRVNVTVPVTFPSSSVPLP